jgi:hypothetical protein
MFQIAAWRWIVDLTSEQIAEALEAAPAWSLLALTVEHPRLREDGRRELARHLAESLASSLQARDQLTLPL